MTYYILGVRTSIKSRLFWCEQNLNWIPGLTHTAWLPLSEQELVSWGFHGWNSIWVFEKEVYPGNGHYVFAKGRRWSGMGKWERTLFWDKPMCFCWQKCIWTYDTVIVDGMIPSELLAALETKLTKCPTGIPRLQTHLWESIFDIVFRG